MDINNSGGIAGLPLLFGTGLAELIRRYSEDATIQDIASVVSIIVGTLAAIHYLLIIGEKVYKFLNRNK